MTVKYPIWINKIEGAAQTPEEMNGIVEVLQNHAENLSLQQKQILTSSGGIYPEKVIPSSPFPEGISQAVFLVGPGTYPNFGNKTIPANNLGLIFFYNSTFDLVTIEIPVYDDTSLKNKVTNIENRTTALEDKIEPNGNVTAGQTARAVNGDKVERYVQRNSFVEFKHSFADKDGYEINSKVFVDNKFWISKVDGNKDYPSKSSTKWKEFKMSADVDQEFDENSENAISNKKVTPLANALDGFTKGEITILSMTGAEAGLRDDLKNFYSNTTYRCKIFDLPTGDKYLNFRGYKPNAQQQQVDNYSCVFVELDNGVIQKIIPATFNSYSGDLVELKNTKLPNNAVKMYVNVMWNRSSVNYPTLIEISNGEISNVKDYVDSKTHYLDVLNGEKVIPLIYTNVGIYDSNGNFVATTGFRSTIIPITSNSKSFRFKGNQAAIGVNWASGVEDFICIAFKMNDNTFDIVLHPIVSQTIMIDKIFTIPPGAKEIYLSWQNLEDGNKNAILPELFFVDEPLTLEEYFSSINSRVPKSDKYDLSWRNFLGVNKINISESFVTGTQQERIQQALDFAEGKSITLILGKDHLSGSSIWNIESSLLIGDDTALVIEKGITIKFSKNYVVDTIIRNKGIGTVEGAALHSTEYMSGTGRATTNKNIIILGAGEEHTLIEGSDIPYRANRPFTTTEEDWVGDEYGWRTLSILMCNVDGLEIGGFSMRKPKCWMIPIFHATNFWIHDLDLLSRVRNGDGVDVIACKGGIVENITCDLYDDAVVVAYVSRRNMTYPHYQYIYPSIPNINDVKDKPVSYQDGSDVDVRNIKGDTRSVLCRVIVVDGPKVSNVTFNNIVSYDLGRKPISAVTIEGNYEGNITPPAKLGDVKNISVNNVYIGNKTHQWTAMRVDNIAQDIWINDVVNKSNKALINSDKPSDLKMTNIK